MRELETVQKREKLNKVIAVDEKGNGNAHHRYRVEWDINGYVGANEIQFQNGARKESGSISGVLDNDLLEIVKDRISSFQSGPFPSEENEQVLHHVEQALYWMNERVENRIKRNVLGTNQK